MKKKKASEDTGLGRWLRSPELGHPSMIPFGKEMKEQVQQSRGGCRNRLVGDQDQRGSVSRASL